MKQFLLDLKNEFKGYNGQTFAKDIMAGLTVTAVALPLALAFGVGSGATAASGLITAIIAGIIIGGLSGASFQISGPTGAMTAILIMLTQKYGMQGMFLATFIAGIMLIVAGTFRLGRIITFIPAAVITGFTSGIAVVIALGQLDNFFGTVPEKGHLAIHRLYTYVVTDFAPDLHTVIFGLAVVIIMVIWPQKLNSKIPSSLVGLVAVLVANTFLKWDVAVVGNIPKTLLLDERLSFVTIPWDRLGDMVVPAMSIAALAMIESLLCGASAGKLKGEKLRGDRELVAQGIGNIIVPFFGGVPATAAIARTSVAIKSGGVTRLTGMLHAVGLLLSMFLLAPVMSAIPLSALAGVLMVTAWRMNDWHNIHYIFGRKFKTGMAEFVITMVATVLLDLTQAIVIGVAFSALAVMVRMTDIDISVSELDETRLAEAGIEIKKINKSIRVVYFTGTIFFAVVEKLNRKLENEETDVLIFSMRGVPFVDLSGVQALTELAEQLTNRGTKILLTSAQPKVLDLLHRGGMTEIIGEEHIFRSAEFAIVHAQEEDE